MPLPQQSPNSGNGGNALLLLLSNYLILFIIYRREGVTEGVTLVGNAGNGKNPYPLVYDFPQFLPIMDHAQKTRSR